MSKTFTANVYDVTRDRYDFRDFTREALLDDVVARSLYRMYPPHGMGAMRDHLLKVLRSLSRFGLDAGEVAAVRKVWVEWWRDHEGKVYEQVVLVPLRV